MIISKNFLPCFLNNVWVFPVHPLPNTAIVTLLTRFKYEPPVQKDTEKKNLFFFNIKQL